MATTGLHNGSLLQQQRRRVRRGVSPAATRFVSSVTLPSTAGVAPAVQPRRSTRPRVLTEKGKAAAPGTSEGVDGDDSKGVSVVEEESEQDEIFPSEVTSEGTPVKIGRAHV